jgi:hypothetical protein
MRPEVSMKGVSSVSPAWLRPSALLLAVLLHLVVLFGIGPPRHIKTAIPQLVELELAARAEPPLETSVAPTEIAEMSTLPANAVHVRPDDATALELAPVEMPPSIAPVSAPSALSTNAAPPHTAALETVEPESSASRNASHLQQDVIAIEKQVAELSPLETAPPAVADLVARAAEAQLAGVPDTPLIERRQEAETLATAPRMQDSSLGHPPIADPIDRPAAVSPNLMPTAPTTLGLPTGTSTLPSDQARALAAGLPEQPVLGPSSAAVIELDSLSRAPMRPAALPASAVDPIDRPTATGSSSVAMAKVDLPGQALMPLPGLAQPESAALSSATDAPFDSSLPSLRVTEPEPYSSIPGTILPDRRTTRPEAVERIIRYVQRYDGGHCFFVAPVAVTETTATFEGYGESPQPFERLDADFLHENGFEASIDVRLVTLAQCPAVRLLSRLRGPDAPHLHVDATNLRPGAPLTGSVDATEGRSIELLLVTDSGAVRNISRLFKPDAAGRTFIINLADLEGASIGQPQLLIAVASAHPLGMLRFDRPMPADWLLSSVLAETARTHEPVLAMARYFKLEQ